MKASMPQIAANEKLRRRICDDIINKRLSHAYIIEGAPGTGRKLFARSIAKALACLNKYSDGVPLPCDSCESCRKISEGLSPDVVFVRREEDKATVGVEAARFIKSDINIVPNDIDYKIYIIEEADRMTDEAQNALLLTLESPPPYAIILLICEKASSLLETVKSRAPVLRTEPVSKETMIDFLCNYASEETVAKARRLRSSEPAIFDEIITASAGGIGYAYELLDREKRESVLKDREQVRNFIRSALNTSDKTVLIDTVAAFPQKREELSVFLDTVMLALRDLIILKKSETAPLCFYSDRDEALELSSLRSASYLLKFLAACEEASASLLRKSNIKLTTTILITSL